MWETPYTTSSENNVETMQKPRVLVTRRLFPEAIKIIEESAEVEVYPSDEDPIPREVLLEKAKDKEGLLLMLTDRADGELFDAAPRLRVVSNYAVGYNNIDVAEATRRGILVTNTPGVLTDATADCAFMLLLAVSRRLVEVDRFVREGRWVKAWGPRMLLGSEVTGKTLGILGLGRIGRAMVPRAKGFKMRVLYHSRTRNKEAEEKLGVEYRSFEGLLRESDYLSIHVPLTEETRGMIGVDELRMMKPTAYLINTARGPVVDEEALIRALKEGWIAGAGLDVHAREPLEPDNPLIKLDNVVLTPHIGSATYETRLAMALKAAENLVAALRGQRPPDLVNPEATNRD